MGLKSEDQPAGQFLCDVLQGLLGELIPTRPDIPTFLESAAQSLLAQLHASPINLVGFQISSTLL